MLGHKCGMVRAKCAFCLEVTLPPASISICGLHTPPSTSYPMLITSTAGGRRWRSDWYGWAAEGARCVQDDAEKQAKAFWDGDHALNPKGTLNSGRAGAESEYATSSPAFEAEFTDSDMVCNIKRSPRGGGVGGWWQSKRKIRARDWEYLSRRWRGMGPNS